uniref:Uncharacterized protein n=1 Tax=Ascaris lumbricoides TaxID=6252 RepID=A0A0M3INP5_ASCLU
MMDKRFGETDDDGEGASQKAWEGRSGDIRNAWNILFQGYLYSRSVPSRLVTRRTTEVGISKLVRVKVEERIYCNG